MPTTGPNSLQLLFLARTILKRNSIAVSNAGRTELPNTILENFGLKDLRRHSHGPLCDSHIQVAQHVVRVLLRAVMLEGMTHTDRLLPSGPQWRLLGLQGVGYRDDSVQGGTGVRAIGYRVGFPVTKQSSALLRTYSHLIVFLLSTSSSYLLLSISAPKNSLLLW